MMELPVVNTPGSFTKAYSLVVNKDRSQARSAQVQNRSGQRLQGCHFKLAARKLGVDWTHLHAGKAEALRGELAVQREIDSESGCRSQGIGINQIQGLLRAPDIVDKGLGETRKPHGGG
jgi:hypothetical protein